MVREAVLMLVLAASPVSAQWNTNCSTIGNQTNCRTTAPPPVYQTPQIQQFDMGAVIRNAEAARAARAQREAYEAAARAEGRRMMAQADQRVVDEADRETRQRVGELLSQGECDIAADMALKRGNIELATQAKAYCAAK